MHAAGILAPGDFIIAVDANRNLPGNTNVGGEGPQAAFDGSDGTKWLSFGRSFTGLIVTPATAGTVVNSMSFTAGGDAPERDPVVYQLYGTNAPVTSANNDTGLAESWTLISTGATGLAPASATATPRGATGPTVNFANTTAYTSYKVVFPVLRSANANIFDPGTLANGATPNSVQLGELRMFDTGSNNIFATAPSSVVAIDQTDSFYPSGERPNEAIDGVKTSGSKHLNFGREGSGIIVTPSSGSSVIDGMMVTTANDVQERDPSDYSIYGTNDLILSLDNSEGTAENWTLITNGTMALPVDRNTDGPLYTFANSTAYTSYKVIFNENKGPDTGANSIQFSEIQLFTNAIPEPSGTLLLGLTGAGLLVRRRRRS
jgi:hypothetical protein